MKKIRPKIVKETIPAKHIYTGPELQEMGARLAQNNQKVRELEDQKKETMSDFKARIDAVDSEIHLLASQIGKGYEMRSTRCTVEFFTKKRTKKYFTEDGHKLVAERPMTEADYQTEFPIGAEEAPATPPAEKTEKPSAVKAGKNKKGTPKNELPPAT